MFFLFSLFFVCFCFGIGATIRTCRDIQCLPYSKLNISQRRRVLDRVKHNEQRHGEEGHGEKGLGQQG